MPTEKALFAGAVDGLRVWRIVGTDQERPMLAAQGVRHVWPPGETMRAYCLAPTGHRRRDEKDEPHIAPSSDCSCGIYALHPGHRHAIAQAERSLATPGLTVSGVVSGWGRLEVHLAGFRAEYARPSVLFERGDDARTGLVRQLGESYGARVVPIPDLDALRAFAKAELRGIAPKVARELVVDGFELRLAPAMETFIGGSNEPVASSGYRFDPDCDIDPDAPALKRLGFSMFPVAGVSYRHEALQDPAFAPGRPVRLVPEPENPADSSAIAIWDEELRIQVGYVPRGSLRRVRFALKAGRIKRALVVWQYRGMNSGDRSGIRILTSPTARIQMREPVCGEPFWANNEDMPF